MDDPRNEMYLQYVRMLSTLQPRVFIMENVPNMLLPAKGPVAALAADDIQSHATVAPF